VTPRHAHGPRSKPTTAKGRCSSPGSPAPRPRRAVGSRRRSRPRPGRCTAGAAGRPRPGAGQAPRPVPLADLTARGKVTRLRSTTMRGRGAPDEASRAWQSAWPVSWSISPAALLAGGGRPVDLARHRRPPSSALRCLWQPNNSLRNRHSHRSLSRPRSTSSSEARGGRRCGRRAELRARSG
jgi:hypothetical protein